jgi:hypothetical protein
MPNWIALPLVWRPGQKLSPDENSKRRETGKSCLCCSQPFFCQWKSLMEIRSRQNVWNILMNPVWITLSHLIQFCWPFLTLAFFINVKLIFWRPVISSLWHFKEIDDGVHMVVIWPKNILVKVRILGKLFFCWNQIVASLCSFRVRWNLNNLFWVNWSSSREICSQFAFWGSGKCPEFQSLFFSRI